MTKTIIMFLGAVATFAPMAGASDNILGTAQRFGVLAGSTLTNTGSSVITGDAGVWPGTSITGFPPALVLEGELHWANALTQQAQRDARRAYDSLASMAPTQELTGTDLGGLTLTPGVYRFTSSAMLTSMLTLDALGDPDAMFVFQIGSTLTTATASSVAAINAADGCNVYWQIGSSATLGTGTDFLGSLLATASITLTTGARIVDGRALAINGAVTMDTNDVTAGCIPAPGVPLVLLGCSLGYARRRRTAV